MLPRLEFLFGTLELQKTRVLKQVGEMYEDGIRPVPDNGNWSALDVVEHVIRVEEQVLAESHKTRASGAGKARVNRLKIWAVLAVMHSPIRIKVPKGAEGVLPNSRCDLHELTERWTVARRDLHKYLEAVSVDNLNYAAFRHPVSGWMTVNDMARFLVAHLRHHRYQLDRLTAAK